MSPPPDYYALTEPEEDEYAVKRTIRNVEAGDKIRYVVCWYWFQRRDDTMEPPCHIL